MILKIYTKDGKIFVGELVSYIPFFPFMKIQTSKGLIWINITCIKTIAQDIDNGYA